MTTKRTLPADVYDALELSAEAFGGIGAGQYFDYIAGMSQAPRCAIGHFAWVCDSRQIGGPCGIESEANAMGLTTDANDSAVMDINIRLGVTDTSTRVPFDLWAAELGVERGS